MAAVRPLHTRMGQPQPGDWLTEHHEPGQTFARYRAIHPTLPDERRRVLVVQPLGTLSATQRQVIELSADYMGRFFQLPIRIASDLPSSLVPPRARRVHPSWGMPQIHAGYVLDELLGPRLPKDAAAYIAFTASDLWPGEGWNFVFGQASLRDRVGVWSIYRNGDPAAGPEAFTRALRRTLKTAVHETAHMFSLEHCTAYQCVMDGANNLEEADRHPLWLCPECMAKLCWAIHVSPIERYRALAEFAAAHGLGREREMFDQSIRAIEGAPP